MVNVSTSQEGIPGSSLTRSVCFRKMEFRGIVIRVSHQCCRQVHQSHAMCYHVCVMMYVKDPRLSVVIVGHFVL